MQAAEEQKQAYEAELTAEKQTLLQEREAELLQQKDALSHEMQLKVRAAEKRTLARPRLSRMKCPSRHPREICHSWCEAYV